jgi:hypothetical protein
MKMLSNTPPPRESRELWKHFSKTYLSMRAGLVLLAFTMPFVLYLYGKFRHGLDLQPSMSAYFWAATEGQCATFPMRTIFVGYLFATGVGLLLYKGLTNLENSLLNGAALCAFTIAIYPESIDSETSDPRILQLFESCDAIYAWAKLPSLPIHLVAAIVLFVLLAIVAWFCAEKSLDYLPADHNRAKYRSTYRIIGIAMLLFPVAGYVVAFVLGLLSHKVFFIEAAGVITFGVYWAVKTRELKLSSLESDPTGAIEYAVEREKDEAEEAEPDDRQF